MEVNKEQAEKCRDLGAAALRQGEYPQAVKMLQKSLSLFPLPGVDALYTHAQSKLLHRNSNTTNGSPNTSTADSTDSRRESTKPNNSNTANHTTTSNNTNNTSRSSNAAAATSSNSNGADGRAYTTDQVALVKRVLTAKETGGRGAHYRVLEIAASATESEIKKAYRKLSLKVHPDKNSAPHSDEAFKAVGLAYATLSDSQKRSIYDRYGDEDPDNRGGGVAGGGMRRRGPHGPEMSPEDIFNAFFGGGGMAPGGGGGVHFYSTGFGPGMQFRAGGMPQRRQQRQQQQQGDPSPPGIAMLMQLLPVLFFVLLSFMGQSNTTSTNTSSSARRMAGEDQYFSLTNKVPFTNSLATKLSNVKDIPYFVSNKFMRTYYRDRYQLTQVEFMVERAYENYLIQECRAQRDYKNRLRTVAEREAIEEERTRQLKVADEFELSRCDELFDLFPNNNNFPRTR